MLLRKREGVQKSMAHKIPWKTGALRTRSQETKQNMEAIASEIRMRCDDAGNMGHLQGCPALGFN